MNIQLKPNTYYKTRDGRKAFVGFRIPGSSRSCPWIGRVDSDTSVYTWVEKGSYKPNLESPEDLISEWTEPKLRPWWPEEVPYNARFQLIGRTWWSLICGVDMNGCPVIALTKEPETLDRLFRNWRHSTDGGKTWLPCGVVE